MAHCTKRMKGKNHMIISKDTEETFDKIQHHLIKKISKNYAWIIPQQNQGVLKKKSHSTHYTQ